MAITVSVEHISPRYYTVEPMLLLIPSGNPFKYHNEVLYLQPMIPPKRFVIFPLTGGCSEGLDVFIFFFEQLPRVRRHGASSPQGSSSNGCCLFRYHHGQTNVRLSFSTPTIGIDYSGHVRLELELQLVLYQYEYII